MANFDYQRYPVSFSAATVKPQRLEDSGSRIRGISVRQLTAGVSFNLHLGVRADPIAVYQGDMIDLENEDYTAGLWYSVPTAPAGASTAEIVVIYAT